MKKVVTSLVFMICGMSLLYAGKTPHIKISLSDLLDKAGIVDQIKEDKDLQKWLKEDTSAQIYIYCTEIVYTEGEWISRRPKANIPGVPKGAYADNGDFIDQSVSYLGHDAEARTIEGKKVRSIDKFVYIFNYSWKGKKASVIIPFLCSIKRYKDKQPELLAFEVNKKRSLVVINSQKKNPPDKIQKPSRKSSIKTRKLGVCRGN